MARSTNLSFCCLLLVVCGVAYSDPIFGRPRHPKHKCPPPKIQYVPKYETQYQQVPVYQTVYETEYVPSPVYETVFKTKFETVLKKEFVPTYVTKLSVSTQFKYLTEFETVFKTKTFPTTVFQPQYVTHTEFQTQFETKLKFETVFKTQFQPTYVTTTSFLTEFVPKYVTVTETEKGYETYCPPSSPSDYYSGYN
ncbi:UNVERIFIED_CONTAM: hypothetical protein RMT77_003657 [Armadillidium vulgare]